MPRPRGDEVLLSVAAAGLGRSDLRVVDGEDAVRLPQTLGHEVCGHVLAVGDAVRGLRVGTPVLVYGWWGCGRCPACTRGDEHLCPDGRRCGGTAPGGFADALLVPHRRHLIMVEGLDLIGAPPLADTALTPYHAVQSVREHLRPGTAAVVVGAGPMGQLAIQLLDAFTSVQVVAVDTDPRREGVAREAGARQVVDLLDWHTVRSALRGVPAAVAFDFSGTEATVELCARVVAPGGRVVIASPGGAELSRALLSMPAGAEASRVRGGSRQELAEVVRLARDGHLRMYAQRYQLDRVNDAVTAVRAGWVRGAAVIVPFMA
jgi:propanol-preferring alcohol dehydrogenase